MIGFWDVYKRSETGPFIKEQEFDRQVGTAAGRLVQKHEIRFEPEQVIPADDALADRVYQAALDLFLELGIYCRDTSRLIKFSREELQWALKHAPTTVTYGQGPDTRVMKYRTIEDPLPPFCLNTPVPSVKRWGDGRSNPARPRKWRRRSGTWSSCGRRPVPQAGR
jgi:methylamine--corrinoid protein Co-methyltransferase